MQGDFGNEEYLGTAKLALRETLAPGTAAHMPMPEASIHPSKCNTALAGMLPCEDQIAD